jgi:hypothetical protein
MKTLDRPQQVLLAQWIVATVVGWMIGFYVCEAIKQIISTLFTDGLVIGTAIGLAQWLVLRRRIERVGWWLPASIVGFGAGKALAQLVLPGLGAPELATSAITGILIGLAVGVLQGLILRRAALAPVRWILANVLGWALGWAVIAAADLESGAIAMAYLIGAAGAAIAALVTGYVLATDLERDAAAAGV